MERRRRVESSVSETESDVDFLTGLEEDLGVAPTVADPATTQLSSSLPFSASTVPASSRALKVEHCLPVFQPLCQVSGRLQDNLRTGSPR